MRFATLLLPILAACQSALRVQPDAGLAEAGLIEQDQPLRSDSDAGLERKTTRKIDEDMIARVKSFPARPEFPGKFAVVRIAREHGIFRAESPTRKEMRPFEEALGRHPAVLSLDPVPGMLLPPTVDLISLRYAAARIGARYLIVYGSDARQDQGWTWAANLNWLLVPYFVIPSTEIYAAAASEAMVVDAHTNAIYFTANGFRESRTVYWSLAAREDSIQRTLEELGDGARRSMAEEIARKLGLLR